MKMCEVEVSKLAIPLTPAKYRPEITVVDNTAQQVFRTRRFIEGELLSCHQRMIPGFGIDFGTARGRRERSSKSGWLASKRGDRDTIPLSLAVKKYPLRQRWRDVG
jgi:hypothetical protein